MFKYQSELSIKLVADNLNMWAVAPSLREILCFPIKEMGRNYLVINGATSRPISHLSGAQ